MKHITTKLAAVLLLATGSVTTTAYADSGSGFLLHDPTATDYYRVECDEYTDHMYLQVSGNTSKTAPIVSAQIRKDDSNAAVSTTDPVSGDFVSSKVVRLQGGPGFYNIIVSKTKPGIVAYGLTFHCEDKNYEHTVTQTPSPLQDDISN